MDLKNRMIYFLFPGILFFNSCSEKNTSALNTNDKFIDTVNTVPHNVKPETKRDSVVDYTARYIAGLKQTNNNPFTELQNNNYWKNYALNCDKNWQKIKSQRLDSIDKWRELVFSNYLKDSFTVFYPFSGPDFLHLYHFFPYAQTYIMMAMEPISDIPEITKLNPETRQIFLESVDNALRDVYHKSYFITKNMAADLQGNKAKGVLPVFYTFITRTGHEIRQIKKVTLDKKGKLIDSLWTTKNFKGVKGIKFILKNHQLNQEKTLLYFDADISDKGLGLKPELEIFISMFDTVNTFIKSASYLLHYSTFSKIRKFILDKSHAIFQDDTGIPYKYVKNDKKMNIILFGEYTRPVKDFGDYTFQYDLDSAYQKNKQVQKLPYHLGYHWGDKKQSWQLFIKN
jgi:hypothetical protein